MFHLLRNSFVWVSASLLGAFSISSSAATVYEPDYRRMHPEAIAYMEELADGHYDLRTEIPGRMRAGQNGYAIITTKARRDALKSLPAFVQHKRNRGFNVILVTEDDFGGGTGLDAALNIRRWLQANYEEKKLLYVLMLGNPHPEEGDIPFKKVRAPNRELGSIMEAGSVAEYAQQNPDFKNLHGYIPTDYFYVDLDSNWDANGNGLMADNGDFGEGGINGQWEVLVGRIPYYDFDGFSGTEDTDRQLQRIIRYENEQGDLSWRHNMFYNGGVFSRDISFYNDAMRFNGAMLYRQTFHGSGLMYEPEIPFGHQHSDFTAKEINRVNDGRFGMAYFQGHGFPQAGGGMSSGSAKLLSDEYPKVFASGACDVASPEHPNNMMNSLLVHAGIAAYGGTRSVTGNSGNRWLKHGGYYTPFYFGNSTGETLWRVRSWQSKDGRIGHTNFMINLYGDPSIVPMPQLHGPEIGVTPGWKTVLKANEGSQASHKLPYEIRNNSTQRQSYRVQAHRALKDVPTQFSLAPGEVKRFTATFNGVENAPPGEYEIPIRVTASNGQVSDRGGVILKIEPKQILVYEPFNKPAATEKEYEDGHGNKVKDPVPTSEVLAPGVYGSSMLVKEHEYYPLRGHWASRSNFSVSFFVRLKSLEGLYDIVNCGPFRIIQEHGKLACHSNTNRWTLESKRQNMLGPELKEGWNFVSVSVDRSAQKVYMTVDDETAVADFNITLQDNMDLEDIKIYPGRGAPMFQVDELTAHNYVLEEVDRKALRYHYVAKPRTPRYHSTVNNEEVTFMWDASGENRRYEFQLADNPQFTNATGRELNETRTSMSNLVDGKEYYWRVNFVTPSGARLKGTASKFIASSDVQRINLRPNQGAKLPELVTGVAGYNKSLRGLVKGIGRRQWDDTVFAKVSGPSWLEVHTDGTLFTNYGAPESAQGKNSFVAEVIAPDGQSMEVAFDIMVVPDGTAVSSR